MFLSTPKKHIESTKDIYEKYSNNKFWVAHSRVDVISRAQDEWNYLTIDGFDSKEYAMKSWSVPKKVSVKHPLKNMAQIQV